MYLDPLGKPNRPSIARPRLEDLRAYGLGPIVSGLGFRMPVDVVSKCRVCEKPLAKTSKIDQTQKEL